MTIRNMEHKNTYPFSSVSFRLPAEAVEWLSETTTDNDGNEIRNMAIFGGLLKDMRTTPRYDAGYRSTSSRDKRSSRKSASPTNGISDGRKRTIFSRGWRPQGWSEYSTPVSGRPFHSPAYQAGKTRTERL